MWDWTIKKAEHRRIDAFELWCWRRLLRVPWTARRSNYSILKKFSPEYSLERLMLKLKLQYFGHLVRRTDSLERTLMLGKIEGRRRRGQQRMRWLDGIITQWSHEFEQAPGVGDIQGSLVCCSPWGHKELDMTEQLNWLTLISGGENITVAPYSEDGLMEVRWSIGFSSGLSQNRPSKYLGPSCGYFFSSIMHNWNRCTQQLAEFLHCFPDYNWSYSGKAWGEVTRTASTLENNKQKSMPHSWRDFRD